MPTPLTTETSIDDRPAFSPDGQQIAFVSDRGGEQRDLADQRAGRCAAIAWRTKSSSTRCPGRATAGGFSSRGPRADLPVLASVAVADGKIEPFVTPAPGAFAPGWSPNGEMLAYLEPTMVQVAAAVDGGWSRECGFRFVDANGQRLIPATSAVRRISRTDSWRGRRTANAWRCASVPANGAAKSGWLSRRASQPFKKLVDLPTAFRPRGHHVVEGRRSRDLCASRNSTATSSCTT